MLTVMMHDTSKKQTMNFYVTPLDSSCTLMLGHRWLTAYNPSIDWVKGSIHFHAKVTPVLPLSPTPMLSPKPIHPKLSPADRSKPGKPPRVTLINAKVFACESTMKGSQCFRLQVVTPEATGQSATNLPGPINLDRVPKEYHNFADIFSKSKASILADHHPYDPKITLKDGALPPLRPIYLLLQEELLTLRKFIDENTATGFIHPSRSPHGAPVLFIQKKDGSLRVCCDFQGIYQVSKKDQYLLLLINDLLDAPRKVRIYTKIDLQHAYHLVRVTDGDEWKTMFQT